MAEKEIDELKEVEEGKSSRLMLVFGLIGGVILGGGGVYGGLMLMGGQDSGTQVAEDTVEEEEPESEEPEPLIDLVYLSVDRMPAPVVGPDGQLWGYVFLDLSLEIAGGGNQSYVSERMPRIQDAFLRAITAQGLTKPGSRGEIDYDRVSKYLLETVNQTIGNGYVSGVFITKALRAPA